EMAPPDTQIKVKLNGSKIAMPAAPDQAEAGDEPGAIGSRLDAELDRISQIADQLSVCANEMAVTSAPAVIRLVEPAPAPAPALSPVDEHVVAKAKKSVRDA